MNHKYFCLIYERLTPITTFGSKSIHTSSNNVAKTTKFASNVGYAIIARLASILQACSDESFLRQGQKVHAQLIVNGISVSFLDTKVLGMYVLCGSFIDAKRMFHKLDLCYPAPWNWVIRGCTIIGRLDLALLFYFKMINFGTSPDKYTFPYVVKACGGLNAINLGKWIHTTIRDIGLETDMFVGSSLIKLYSDNNCRYDAQSVFDKMSQKDCVLWNVMLNGYVKNGEVSYAIELFRKMINTENKPNSVTFACVLSLCASDVMIGFGTQNHALVIKYGLEMDSPVANTLLAMYAKCRHVSDSRKLFDSVPKSDSVTWNGMISGFVQNGLMLDAQNLFRDMICSGVKPDSITFSSFLPSISESENLDHCKEIHCYIIRNSVKMDVYLKSALIDIYLKCRDVKMVSKIFKQRTTIVDIVIYTAMISGYVLNGMNWDAVEIFRWLMENKMKPNSVTLASILPATACLAALKLGKELHSYILKNGYEKKCYVGCALMDMYAKCGRLDLCHQIFEGVSDKDTVCWNSMITSFSQNGKPEEAIDLFRKMGLERAKYDYVSLSAALSACANLPALQSGKEIHGFMIRNLLSSDLFAESALIDLYAKCGNLELSLHVFTRMKTRNEVSWNSIISAYGNHGRLKESFDMYYKMLELGLQPDHVTFLSLISACGHAGKVDEGAHYFHSMTEQYGITARMEHYACMVDLYGRAGHLKEAFEIVKGMPFEPDAGIWGTLLGACRVHGNVDLAELASERLFELDPQNSGYYVLLSNLQADAGRWENVLRVRSLMKERKVNKVPGYSWIEVNNQTHLFFAADGSHLQSDKIYDLLKYLLLEMQREGIVNPKPSAPRVQITNFSLPASMEENISSLLK